MVHNEEEEHPTTVGTALMSEGNNMLNIANGRNSMQTNWYRAKDQC